MSPAGPNELLRPVGSGYGKKKEVHYSEFSGRLEVIGYLQKRNVEIIKAWSHVAFAFAWTSMFVLNFNINVNGDANANTENGSTTVLYISVGHC